MIPDAIKRVFLQAAKSGIPALQYPDRFWQMVKASQRAGEATEQIPQPVKSAIPALQIPERAGQAMGAMSKVPGGIYTATSPLEAAADIAIRKDDQNIAQRALSVAKRGPDIGGALESRGIPSQMAVPLGIAASIAIPGSGELSSAAKLPGKMRKVTKIAEEIPVQPKLPETISRVAKQFDVTDVKPVINTKRAIPITDIHGQKAVIAEGEALTPYELTGNKVLLKDDYEYVVNKNQYQNIKGQSKKAEAQPFAPELDQTVETVKGKGEIQSYEKAPKPIQSIIDEYQAGNIDDATARANAQASGYGLNFDMENAGVISNIYKIESDPTKYSHYTLPGGENYREILIQAPLNEADLTKRGFYLTDAENGGVNLVDREGVSRGTWPDKQSALKSMVRETGFKGGHWDEPNVISHVRMNDRTYNGKKVAFMEEMQSDWAREARKTGIKNPNPNAIKEFEQYNSELAKKYNLNPLHNLSMYGTIKHMKPEEIAKWNQLQAGYIDATKGVSSQPLLKDWQKVSVKRALKDAVDNDAEYFAWTTGEQQAARYNLSKQVDNINWFTNHDNSQLVSGKIVEIYPTGGHNHIQVAVGADNIITGGNSNVPHEWVGKNITDVVGKGIGEKIIAKSDGTLSGESLNIGGEWAYNLYDRQVKNIVEDVTGGKVENLDLGLSINKDKPFFINGHYGMERGIVTSKDVKVGKTIYLNGTGDFVIIDDLGNGKFKAVPISDIQSWGRGIYKDIPDTIKAMKEVEDGQDWKILLHDADTFDVSSGPLTSQQAIRLTPEIKAKIRGEAPLLKQSSGAEPTLGRLPEKLRKIFKMASK